MKLFASAILCAVMTWAQAPAPADDTARLEQHLNRDEKILKDWANLGRYREENAKLAPPAAGENRVVFMGDSITDNWGRRFGKFFPGEPYINRGISGQTTPQMLVRFRADVIDLKPKVVLILGGTNDIAGNTGPESLEEIEGYLASMAQLAKANKIKVVLAALMPVTDAIRPQTEQRPSEKIIALNKWILAYCKRDKIVYLDYYTPLLDANNMFKKELTVDGLHPNAAGYDVIAPVAERAIAKALK